MDQRGPIRARHWIFGFYKRWRIPLSCWETVSFFIRTWLSGFNNEGYTGLIYKIMNNIKNLPSLNHSNTKIYQTYFTKRVTLETSNTLNITYHRIPQIPAEEIPRDRFLQIYSLHEVQAAKSSLNWSMIWKRTEFWSGSRSWVVTVVSIQHPHRIILKDGKKHNHINKRERVFVC
jgi:hypothetical protein